MAHITVRIVYGDYWDRRNQGEAYYDLIEHDPGSALSRAVSLFAERFSLAKNGSAEPCRPPVVSAAVVRMGDRPWSAKSFGRPVRQRPARGFSELGELRGQIAVPTARGKDGEVVSDFFVQPPPSVKPEASPRAGRSRGSSAASRPGGRRANGISASGSRRRRA